MSDPPENVPDDVCSKPRQVKDDQPVTQADFQDFAYEKQGQLRSSQKYMALHDVTQKNEDNGDAASRNMVDGINHENIPLSPAHKESRVTIAMLKPKESDVVSSQLFQHLASQLSIQEYSDHHHITKVMVIIRGDMSNKMALARGLSNIIGTQLTGFNGELGVLWINTGESVHYPQAVFSNVNVKIFQIMECGGKFNKAAEEAMKEWMAW